MSLLLLLWSPAAELPLDWSLLLALFPLLALPPPPLPVPALALVPPVPPPALVPPVLVPPLPLPAAAPPFALPTPPSPPAPSCPESPWRSFPISTSAAGPVKAACRQFSPQY